MAEETKKPTKNQIELVNVPVDFQEGFQMPDGSVLTTNQALAWLMNEVLTIKKNVG